MKSVALQDLIVVNEISVSDSPDWNDLCSGHLVVDDQRKIVSCNRYIDRLCGLTNKKIVNNTISTFITKASGIFLNSYIYPQLLIESKVEESQITWLGSQGERVSVIVNVAIGEGGLSYWSVFENASRDRLYNELIEAKERLEVQSRELYVLATTDSLTGLINRRELTNQMDRIKREAARNKSRYALLSIDIDFFKKINDRYGHQVGDDVLVGLASVLKQSLRGRDIVARMGGEEFLVVLDNVKEEDALILTKRLRHLVEESDFSGVNITVSLGLVMSDAKGQMDFDALLALSDEALYKSKMTGRNTITVADY